MQRFQEHMQKLMKKKEADVVITNEVQSLGIDFLQFII